MSPVTIAGSTRNTDGSFTVAIDTHAAPAGDNNDDVPITVIDTRLVGMTLTRNGELIDTGAGAAALGDPVAVVAWLANVLGGDGVALEPGHLIMTGALHAAVPMTPGDVFRAEFDRLGPITVRVGD